MARLNPLVPQVFDAQALSTFLRRNRIRGPFEEMNVGDTLVPIAFFGSIPIQPSAPVFEPSKITSSNTVSAGIGVLLTTTGALAAGIYDFSWAIAVQLATNVSWHIQVNLVDDLAAVQDILDFCTPTTGVTGNGAGHRVEAQMAIDIPQDWLIEIRVGAVAPTVNSQTQTRLAWSPRV